MIINEFLNSGKQVEVFYLPVKTKLKCIKTLKGLDDIGMSGLTYECDEFIKDKISEIYGKSGKSSRVVSETNCVMFARTSIFEVVK